MQRSRTVFRSLTLAATLGAALALSLAGGSFAASNPAGRGQPSVECDEEGATLAPNGFSSVGFARAELVYAGSDESHSANNSYAISQYDVACFQVTSNR